MFKDFHSFSLGQSARLVRRVTAEDVRRFTELTGDDNPLHVDADYARTTPFKGTVVHGMLGASFLSTVIGKELPGPGALWVAQSFQFLLPVRVDDTLTITCTVTGKLERERMLDLDMSITNGDGAEVMTGKGRVKVLESTAPRSERPPTRRRVALVTGGSGEVGAAICHALALTQHSVIVVHHDGAERADALVRALRGGGAEACALRGDLRHPEDVRALAERASATFGAPTVLVHAASPRLVGAALSSMRAEDLDAQLQVNLYAFLSLAQALTPRMAEEGFGRLVAITSQVADGVPPQGWTTYAAAKAALASAVRSLAVELGPRGVTANCVSPGMTDTRFIAGIPEKARLLQARQTPLRRIGSVADVAGAVAYLVSDAADFVTGQTLRVNGGAVMS